MLQPMLASLADAPLDDPELVYEPKYDGIRAIAEIAPNGRGPPVVAPRQREDAASSRRSPRRSAQWARARTQPLVLDGEIVALDAKGEPTGFQQLQGRIHLTDASGPAAGPARRARPAPPAREPRRVHRVRPPARRRRPTSAIGRCSSGAPRSSGCSAAPDRRLCASASRCAATAARCTSRRSSSGWEGLIAKHADSLYKSGKRTPDWRKLKIVHEQEFVIGGWTEPRQTRAYFGALLLGVYEGDDLVYVGHTGTGFNERELARVMKLLKPLETTDCPFTNAPKTNERPHWVRPELVAQIKFTEWTADAKLRHPVYLGLRDDKKPRRRPARDEADAAFDVRGSRVRTRSDAERAGRRAPHDDRRTANRATTPNANGDRTSSASSDTASARRPARRRSRRRGATASLDLPDGERLKVTNLHKVFWPKLKLTKGDLFRYYARVAPFILPAVADRPLVMKRFPNGIAAQPFYQHRAPEVPAGVRSAVVSVVEKRPQIIGGSLKTLLYMTQLAAISQDPWFSRVQHRRVRRLRAPSTSTRPRACPSRGCSTWRAGFATSSTRSARSACRRPPGADGLHIYIPLPPGTPYDAGLLFCQIVATVVAQKHPKVATIERTRRARAASASTSTACRTSSARRWRPPTARAPATTPASRRRSPGRRSTTASIARRSRSRRCRRGSKRSAICGRRCGNRKAWTWRASRATRSGAASGV